MKIYSLDLKEVFEIEASKQGENKMPCPSCSGKRKKKTDKCFSWNNTTNVGYCNHCESKFVVYKAFEKKEYKKPEWDGFKEIRDDWKSHFLAKRGISPETLDKLKVSEKKVWMPQASKEIDVVAYPYFKDGELINVKYRGANKSFKLEGGAELIWYNYDALNNEEVTISEGENDCLSFIEDGFENSISVPNGANIGKMEYFDSSIEDLDKVKKFYIAVDNDEKGILLKDELIRRLGADRCYVVNFKDCKDANEYLLKYGRGSLLEAIKNAKQPRIESGIFADDMIEDLQDLFIHGLQKGLSLGFEPLDKYVTWESSLLAVLHGTPSSGKSEMADFISIKLNILHGWKVVYWSPENAPTKRHYAKIYEKIVGGKFKESETGASFWNAYEHIKDNFFWVNPDISFKVKEVLESFVYFIKTKGVKIVIVDPFNMVVAGLDHREQDDVIAEFARFARMNDVLFILVAHPRKLEKDKATGTFTMPTPYDIAGTSGFYNRAGYILGMARHQDIETKSFLPIVDVSIQKIKFKNLGDQGRSTLNYVAINGRYAPENSTYNEFDKRNWLRPEEIEKEKPKVNYIESFENEIQTINEEEIPF